MSAFHKKRLTHLEEHMVRRFLAAATLAAGLVLAGCNTIAGIGEDLESVGGAVENCAEGTTC